MQTLASSGDDLTLFILEAWTPPADNEKTRSIHVYTNAASVKLLVNGQIAEGGDSINVPFFNMASFENVKFEEGNLTAVALDASGKELDSYTVMSTGKVVSVIVAVDAPSKITGTGSYVVADGEDVAMIRASLVDVNGLLVPTASNNVTFTVKSGPGRVWATHSGSPANLSPSQVLS